jgi:hypothetical protein
MAQSNRPEPSEFLVFPILERDLMVFFRNSDITRPFYVNYKDFIKQLTKSITPASALLLQTNSVNNPTQTLLNLIQGSGITITDDGLGGITITATGGGGGTYTANNGLTENPANNFQLGGSTLGTGNLIRNTYISNDGFILRIDQTTGIGLDVRNVLGTAIQGITDNGFAVRGRANSGIAVEGLSYDNVAGYFQVENPDTSTILPVLKLQRNSTGTVFNGMGGSMEIWLEPRITVPVPSPTVPTGTFEIEWLVSGSTVLSRRGQFNISLDKGDVKTRVMHGNANGEIFLDDYGAGTFTGTAAFYAAWDSNGRFIEEPVPSGGTVLTEDSVQGDGTVGNEIKLVNDAATPGVNKVYGTDNSGNRGWRNELIYPSGLIPGTVAGVFPARRNTVTFLPVPSTDRLFVPGITDNIVEIYEDSSGNYLGFVSITGAYSCIYVESLNEVWVSASTTTMTRLDPSTFAVLGTFTGMASVLSYVEVSPTKIYLASAATNTIVDINPSTLSITATITAAALGVTFIRFITYVNNPLSFHHQYLAGVCPSTNEFYAIDTTTNAVAITGTTFGGTVGLLPTGIAYNSVEDNYYISTAQNYQVRILKPTSTTIATFQNRKHAPFCYDLIFDPVTQKIYTVCLQGQNGFANSNLHVQCFDENNLYWTTLTPSVNIEGAFLRTFIAIDSVNGYVYIAGTTLISGFVDISKVKI